MDPGMFTSPGPGSWELETTHVSRPMSRWLATIFPTHFSRGFAAGTKHYGLLLDTFEVAIINGFMYLCTRPVGAPKGAKGPPPKLVFKLLLLLHPEIRRRIRTGRTVFTTKAWRDDIRSWDLQWKPAIAKTNTALQELDPTTLGDAELIAHLTACRTSLAEGIEMHHRLNPCFMLPVGDYLSQAGAWTGLSPGVLLAPMRGSTKVSLGAATELVRAATAIAADPAARTLLASSAPAGEILAALRALPGETGSALKAYVDIAGMRTVTGYDISDRTALEMPEILIGALRSALDAPPAAAHDADHGVAEILERVPADRRAAFDELLAEARLSFRMRDERCYLNDAWSTALSRRAVLAAGARLAQRGALIEAEHAVDVEPDELDALLLGKPGPSAQEAASRSLRRTTLTVADAPALIGPPVSGPPPDAWLPAESARGARAIAAVLTAMFEIAKSKPSAGNAGGANVKIQGLAASAASYEGIARLVLEPEDFARVRKGDILVARNTAPSYNVLLPLLGGIVTDRGGLLSHAAIVAREYGLAAVVGCGTGTKTIKDGARIRIDGATGSVEILA